MSSFYYVPDPRNVPDYEFSHEAAIQELIDHEWRMNQAVQVMRQFTDRLEMIGHYLEDEDIVYRDMARVRELQKGIAFGPWPLLQRNRIADLINSQLKNTKAVLIDRIAQDMLGDA